MQLSEIIRRIIFRLQGRVVRLKPRGDIRGNVLISYITLPFLNQDLKALDAHTNRWECREMAEIFIRKGYAVDVIDFTDTKFIPRKKYTYFIDVGWNMERLVPFLNQDCIKIFHITSAQSDFHKSATEKRSKDLHQRRGVLLSPDRPLPFSRAIDFCDIATMLGNDFTAGTYALVNKEKEIVRIPISTTHTYPSPEQKDFEAARKSFIWFGGAGVIHKGLDLVVEAFAQMPEYTLTICGKIDGERKFLEEYKTELSLPNITIVGFMDPGSDTFKKLCSKTIALVYPSSSEGQSGGVVLTMHAGLIPIISYESGVDVEDFGIILKENTIKEITTEVKRVGNMSESELQDRATKTWQNAQTKHTRERFSIEYEKIINRLESSKINKS